MIGITTYAAVACWGVWELPARLTPTAYVDCVDRAGGLPVLLPSLPSGAPDVLDRVDGVLVCGGPDIAPARYRAESAPQTGEADHARDAFEHALVSDALARSMPLLGICRGMQMLNVVLGGTLNQHLATAHSHGATPGVFATHDVVTSPSTAVARAIGPRTVVHSYHHQGVDSLGRGLQIAATAPDGVVEALERADGGFAVGVLWHPEVGADLSIFRALIDAAGSCCRTE